MTGETAEARLKRMRMRSWRRGTKEMDIVLGPFADARLAGMDAAGLALYDRLLEENDQDLMAWLLGQLPTVIQLIGGALIVAGVALVRIDEMRAADPVAEPVVPAPAG